MTLYNSSLYHLKLKLLALISTTTHLEEANGMRQTQFDHMHQTKSLLPMASRMFFSQDVWNDRYCVKHTNYRITHYIVIYWMSKIIFHYCCLTNKPCTLIGNKIVGHADLVLSALPQRHLHSRLNTFLTQLQHEIRNIFILGIWCSIC